MSGWNTIKLTSYIKRFMQDIHTSGIIVIGVGVLRASFFGLDILLLLILSQKFIAEVFWFSAVIVTIGLDGCGCGCGVSYEYGLDESRVNSETKIMLVGSHPGVSSLGRR